MPYALQVELKAPRGRLERATQTHTVDLCVRRARYAVPFQPLNCGGDALAKWSSRRRNYGPGHNAEHSPPLRAK